MNKEINNMLPISRFIVVVGACSFAGFCSGCSMNQTKQCSDSGTITSGLNRDIGVYVMMDNGDKASVVLFIADSIDGEFQSLHGAVVLSNPDFEKGRIVPLLNLKRVTDGYVFAWKPDGQVEKHDKLVLPGDWWRMCKCMGTWKSSGGSDVGNQVNISIGSITR